MLSHSRLVLESRNDFSRFFTNIFMKQMAKNICYVIIFKKKNTVFRSRSKTVQTRLIFTLRKKHKDTSTITVTWYARGFVARKIRRSAGLYVMRGRVCHACPVNVSPLRRELSRAISPAANERVPLLGKSYRRDSRVPKHVSEPISSTSNSQKSACIRRNREYL